MKISEKKWDPKKSLTLVPKKKVETQKHVQTFKAKKEKIPYGFCDICYQVESDLNKLGNFLIKCTGCNKHAH